MQDAAKENQILLSEDCYKVVKESFKFNDLGNFEMKNKEKPIRVYEVLE
ncbi:MAG: class 3 adenylate cyclase [Paraglaciecola sp.]